MIGWALVWLLAWPMGLLRGRRAVLWNLLFLGALLVIIVIVQSGLLEVLKWDALNANTINRARIGFGDESAQTRAQIAQVAWQKISEAPWLGYGLGATFRFHPEGTHNIFLHSWVESGILGVLLFPALILPLARGRAGGQTFFIFFMLMGFFSHNLLDERSFLLPLGYLLALIPYGTLGNQSTSIQP
jgi:O-antigen ligase